MSCTYCLYLNSYKTIEHLSTLKESWVLYWVNLSKILKKINNINLSNSIYIHISICVCPIFLVCELSPTQYGIIVIVKYNKNTIRCSSKRQYAMQNSNNHHKTKKRIHFNYLLKMFYLFP